MTQIFSLLKVTTYQTGQGIFAFKCIHAEELFNVLQEIMQNNSINVVEEPVVARCNYMIMQSLGRVNRKEMRPHLNCINATAGPN